MKIKTSAKLNLNLEIKNKNSSSLHEISSLIVPIDLYDEIDIVQNEEGFDQIHFDSASQSPFLLFCHLIYQKYHLKVK